METRFKPAVARHWLYAIAGFVWAAVGVMLLRLGWLWLDSVGVARSLVLAALGAGIGVAAGFTLFARIARENIERISRAPDRACVFSFQAWRGYLVMTFMIGLGVLLRHSAIPKPTLAVVYLAVGSGLLIASARYCRALAGKTSAASDSPD